MSTSQMGQLDFTLVGAYTNKRIFKLQSNSKFSIYSQVVRLLINGCCVRNCQRMTPFDFNQLDDFCYSLMDLYDFELL